MLSEVFERTYVINLPARADRRREMSSELARVGKSFTDSDVTLFPAIRPEDAGDFPSLGARGCFLSHLGVLADAEQRGAKRIAILEDDAVFAGDFASRAPAVLKRLASEDWGVFYGGHREFAADRDGLVTLAPDALLLTTHFVAFRGPAIGAARRYLEELLTRPLGDPRGGPMHVDGAYNWFRRLHPEFKAFAAAPPLAGQRSSRSDVASLSWFDRAPGLRSVAQAARRLFRRD